MLANKFNFLRKKKAKEEAVDAAKPPDTEAPPPAAPAEGCAPESGAAAEAPTADGEVGRELDYFFAAAPADGEDPGAAEGPPPSASMPPPPPVRQVSLEESAKGAAGESHMSMGSTYSPLLAPSEHTELHTEDPLGSSVAPSSPATATPQPRGGGLDETVGTAARFSRHASTSSLASSRASSMLPQGVVSPTTAPQSASPKGTKMAATKQAFSKFFSKKSPAADDAKSVGSDTHSRSARHSSARDRIIGRYYLDPPDDRAPLPSPTACLEPRDLPHAASDDAAPAEPHVVVRKKPDEKAAPVGASALGFGAGAPAKVVHAHEVISVVEIADSWMKLDVGGWVPMVSDVGVFTPTINVNHPASTAGRLSHLTPHFTTLCKAFYRYYAPEKLSHLDAFLAEREGDAGALKKMWATLKTRYGPYPVGGLEEYMAWLAPYYGAGEEDAWRARFAGEGTPTGEGDASPRVVRTASGTLRVVTVPPSPPESAQHAAPRVSVTSLASESLGFMRQQSSAAAAQPPPLVGAVPPPLEHVVYQLRKRGWDLEALEEDPARLTAEECALLLLPAEVFEEPVVEPYRPPETPPEAGFEPPMVAATPANPLPPTPPSSTGTPARGVDEPSPAPQAGGALATAAITRPVSESPPPGQAKPLLKPLPVGTAVEYNTLEQGWREDGTVAEYCADKDVYHVRITGEEGGGGAPAGHVLKGWKRKNIRESYRTWNHHDGEELAKLEAAAKEASSGLPPDAAARLADLRRRHERFLDEGLRKMQAMHPSPKPRREKAPADKLEKADTLKHRFKFGRLGLGGLGASPPPASPGTNSKFKKWRLKGRFGLFGDDVMGESVNSGNVRGKDGTFKPDHLATDAAGRPVQRFLYGGHAYQWLPEEACILTAEECPTPHPLSDAKLRAARARSRKARQEARHRSQNSAFVHQEPGTPGSPASLMRASVSMADGWGLEVDSLSATLTSQGGGTKSGGSPAPPSPPDVLSSSSEDDEDAVECTLDDLRGRIDAAIRRRRGSEAPPAAAGLERHPHLVHLYVLHKAALVEEWRDADDHASPSLATLAPLTKKLFSMAQVAPPSEPGDFAGKQAAAPPERHVCDHRPKSPVSFYPYVELMKKARAGAAADEDRAAVPNGSVITAPSLDGAPARPAAAPASSAWLDLLDTAAPRPLPEVASFYAAKGRVPAPAPRPPLPIGPSMIGTPPCG